MSVNKLLESTTEKVSRVLTEKYGMRVVFRGAFCHTDGETIYLPSLPEDVPEELIGALRGWADHECSHALFTEIGVGADFTKKHGPKAFSILNTLEDARVEQLMSEKFPGSGINIRQGYEYVTSGEPPDDIFWALTWALYSRAKGLEDFKVLPPEIYQLLEGCKPELDQVLCCPSTSELATVAESIWLKLADKLESLRQEQQKEQEQQQQDEESSGNSGEPSGQSGSEDGDTDQEQQEQSQPGSDGEQENEAPESENAEDQQDEGGAQPEESEPETGSSAGEAQDEEAAQDEDPESDSGDPETDKGGDGGAGEEPSGEPANEENGDPESDNINPSYPDSTLEPGEDASPMGQLKSRIEEAACPSDEPSSSYRVYTTEHDVVDRPDKSGYRWKDDLAKFRPQVAGLMRRLVHTLRGRSEKNWRREQSRGKLDPGGLHKLATGSSARVFRKPALRDDGATACTLLLDLSGSMQGRQIDMCKKLGLVFGETLSRLSFPTEIIGFSTARKDIRYEISRQTGISERDLARQYSRFSPLYHAVFKDFSEPWSSGASRMGAVKPHALTPLGESLLFAGKRLARRPEQRKVLFCLTDGEPVTGAWDESITMRHACDSAQRLARADIEAVGIGIMENSVKHIFPAYAVIDNLDELPTTFARSLCKVLTSRRRQKK